MTFSKTQKYGILLGAALLVVVVTTGGSMLKGDILNKGRMQMRPQAAGSNMIRSDMLNTSSSTTSQAAGGDMMNGTMPYEGSTTSQMQASESSQQKTQYCCQAAGDALSCGKAESATVCADGYGLTIDSTCNGCKPIEKPTYCCATTFVGGFGFREGENENVCVMKTYSTTCNTQASEGGCGEACPKLYCCQRGTDDKQFCGMAFGDNACIRNQTTDQTCGGLCTDPPVQPPKQQYCCKQAFSVTVCSEVTPNAAGVDADCINGTITTDKTCGENSQCWSPS